MFDITQHSSVQAQEQSFKFIVFPLLLQLRKQNARKGKKQGRESRAIRTADCTVARAINADVARI